MTLDDTPPQPATSDSHPPTGYRPSPRPTYDAPTAIHRADVTRHVWGDSESGEVFDWIYASSELLHVLVFGLAPGGAFRHSKEFRTIFGADEVLCVLSGTMVLANPQTGEVIRVAQGERAFFSADTWHHAFAHGQQPLRVLEFLAPPPASGTTGAYARRQEYLDAPRYVDDSVLGTLPGAGRSGGTLTWLRAVDVVYRLEGDALVGLLASTEHLTVATLTLPPGKTSSTHLHGGDEIVYVTSGTLCVRAWGPERMHVFELHADDAAYVPAGALHEYRNFGSMQAEALIGVAPSYLDASAH